MNMLEIGFETVKVANHWGDRMPMMAMEECGELIQAISKYERALVEVKNRNEKPSERDEAAQNAFDTETWEIYNFARQHLIDEIGDMWISLMALQAHYDDKGDMADRIDARIEYKLKKKY